MKIKVCGITREEDIAELLLAGVDFIGFNFIKSSLGKRNLIITNLPVLSIKQNLPSF